jgi:hypothetical protein
VVGVRLNYKVEFVARRLENPIGRNGVNKSVKQSAIVLSACQRIKGPSFA